VPAQAIKKQFDRAVGECQDPNRLAAWLPMLNQYGPDLLVLCDEVSEMAESVVRGWLEAYMFRDDADKQTKAQSIAGWPIMRISRAMGATSHARSLNPTS